MTSEFSSELVQANVYSSIDPRLQRALERRGRGMAPQATSSTVAGELAVIARVSSFEDWQNISEVREGADIGDGVGGRIVTGRIPLDRVEAVREHSAVLSLKPAQRLRTMLAATIEEIGARADLLPASAQGNQGEGAIVGVVDDGCDFAHENFRHEDGTTRLLALWDQSDPANPNGPFGYGTAYTPDDINKALGQADPYTALGYGPEADSLLQKGTHGTHVMDIAAGNGRGTGTPGVAPKADLIFVHISTSDLPWQGPDLLGASFGDSVQLLEAITYIFDTAGDRPCVINISLGTNGGPHDGSTLVEQGIDALCQGAPNRSVVIAAANSFDDGIHATGTVTEGQSEDLGWNVPVDDFTDNEMEVWYSAGDAFRVELLLPNGASLGSVALGSNGSIRDVNGDTVVFVAHREGDPNNGDNVIGVFLGRGLPAGTWTVRLHGVTVSDGHFHAWIERDHPNFQSNFAGPHDNSHTIGSISCGEMSIAVGSYDAHKPNQPLSWFSSSGPTRNGREKPEISAPGHGVWAAHSRTGDAAVNKSGTSMAAPAVTGVVALALAEARAAKKNLSITQIRQILFSTVRQGPPNAGGNWDPRYGHGRVDASAVVQKV